MAYGFKIKDSSGNVVIESTDTTALLKEELKLTSTGSGTRTYTDAVGQTAYGFGAVHTDGTITAGTWSAFSYNVTTSVNGSNQPTLSYNVTCNDLAPGLYQSCNSVVHYHIFAFTK